MTSAAGASRRERAQLLREISAAISPVKTTAGSVPAPKASMNTADSRTSPSATAAASAA